MCACMSASLHACVCTWYVHVCVCVCACVRKNSVLILCEYVIRGGQGSMTGVFLSSSFLFETG